MEIDDKEGVTALPGAAELLVTTCPDDRFAIVLRQRVRWRSHGLENAGFLSRFPPAPMIDRRVPQWMGSLSPEPFLKGAALLGFPPWDCLVFEDTPAGIASARAAGMQAVALQTTYPAHQLQAANAIIDSLADVKATLTRREHRA